MNFKHVILACAALVAGFTSCSNDDNATVDQQEGKHNLKMKTNLPVISSRADAVTAVGKTPDVTAMTLIFVADGVVDKIHTANVATITSTGETITGITTGTINSVYVFGGGATVAMPAAVATITVGDPESDIKDIMYVMSAQTPGEDAEKVASRAYSTYTAVIGGTSTVAVDLVPAISRIEVKTAEAIAAPVVPANKIHKFDLKGIYINNTFKEIGADYTVYPAANAVNYDSEDAKWNLGWDARYHDALTFTGVTTASATNLWSYYVAPAQKMSGPSYIGTIINEGGTPKQYLATPHIVLKLDNVFVGTASPGTLQANTNVSGQWAGTNTLFVRVTKYVDSSSNQINFFEAGKVYEINKISFDGSNLQSNPVPDPNSPHDVIATVTVKPWEGVTTEVTPD